MIDKFPTESNFQGYFSEELFPRPNKFVSAIDASKLFTK